MAEAKEATLPAITRHDTAVSGMSGDDVGIAPLSGEVFGIPINSSGRRCFTSQRLVLYAVLTAQRRCF
jgi:hypothetical protein